jgi:hypothetical protein
LGAFRPTIGNLIDDLERDPKRHPKKNGKLAGTRAASLTFADGIAWRAVFTVDERSRVVRIIALGPHDEAYKNALRRS